MATAAKKQEVVPAEPAQVPELYRPPAIEIDTEDVALPKLKLGQFTADAVKDQLVKPGCIFGTVGQDDPDPQVFWTMDGKSGDGVIFHVLAMRKGLSYSEPGGDLETWAFGDPEAHEKSWTTYTYTVCLPEHDEDVPYTFLLTRTGKPAAKQINTEIVKNAERGPAYGLAFRLTCAERDHKQGSYFVPRVARVEANEDHVKLAESFAVKMGSNSADVQARNEEPAI